MIEVKNIKVSYDSKVILENFSFKVKEGEMVSIIGPNGCGKSTVLKTISGFLKKSGGKVYLQGEDMDEISAKKIARKMSVLSQYNRNPEDITVEDLVSYGRVPHKKWYEKKSEKDEEIINWALEETGVKNMKDSSILELSGGERQRVWLAMSLAQEPRVLLLDEPTTYLDISHQLEIMELLRKLNRELKITVIMVLHELSQAAKYSDKIIVMKKGKVVGEGRPFNILDEKLIEEVYNVDAYIDKKSIKDEIIIHPIRKA